MISDPVTPLRNNLIRQARSVPDLIQKAERVDPDFATLLAGKALVSTRSPAGVAIAAVVTWAAGKYGLGWDASTVDTVTLVVLVVAAYAMRLITYAPISGIVRPAERMPVPPEVPVGSSAAPKPTP
jgi:hypothetical protein